MGKQLVPLTVLESLEPLPFELPVFSMPSPPFSKGQRPEEYTLDSLKKIESASTSRTDLFRKYVLAIEELIQTPVPYVFRTSNGTIRSMDAGCLGFCTNRSSPYFCVLLNERGFIEAVESTSECDGLRPVIPKLVAEIRQK
jgi:hypothetical protein